MNNLSSLNTQNNTTSSSLGVKALLLALIPQNKIEWFLLAGLLLFYFSFGILFLFNSSIIDHPHQVSDILFGFDNARYFHTGAEKDIHPLYNYFIFPFQFIGSKLQSIFGYKSIGVVMISQSALCISMSVVYLYRYLKDIVRLNSAILWVFTISYSLFFSNLILAFITETYTISICLLIFTIFFFSKSIKEEKELKLSTLILSTCSIGGITITNAAKPLFAFLFTQGKFPKKLSKIILSSSLFILLIGFSFILIKTNGSNNISGEEIKKELDRSISLRSPFLVQSTDTMYDQKYKDAILNDFLGKPIMPMSIEFDLAPNLIGTNVYDFKLMFTTRA